MSSGALLFVGQTVLDQVFRVDRFQAGGGKAEASEHQSRIGGMAARAALAVQQLRTPDSSPSVRLVSAIGDDSAGDALRPLLRAVGLDAECIAGARTAVSAVLVDAGGERQISNYRGDALSRAPVRDLPDTCAGVLADPRWPTAAAAALSHARTSGVPSVFDAELAPADVLRSLVPLAAWCVFSRAGLTAWSGSDEAVELTLARVALEAPESELLVTLGADGAQWRRPDGRVLRLPAFPVAAKDTNGAGDVMHGALLLALADGQAAEAAVRWAMGAAALACTGEPLSRAALNTFLEGLNE